VCKSTPANLFARLQVINPAPFGFIINLGEAEYLVGASPEMYVRVTGRRVETCPISGTIKRGKNPIEDAENIKTLLNSHKDESELTMCTDVDRNDKSRICVPGSVQVIGRRQIEKYSRLIHTVDHVEGTLKPGLDAIDAFLAHTWAVTVTGAPKAWAMQFLEDHEKSQRKWYAGSVGLIGFDGNMNTGLTLRTVHIQKGVATVRAGATLLYHSNPDDEEEETQVKASAFLGALREDRSRGAPVEVPESPTRGLDGKGVRMVMVDHQDSFVHTIGNYIRQTGVELTTVRAIPNQPSNGLDKTLLQDKDFVFLSPGPGSPTDFKTSHTLSLAIEQQLPVYGVCLGLQAIVEHFGGDLDVLEIPMHGKPSTVTLLPAAADLFEHIPKTFTAARYHSLHARKSTFPDCLEVLAETEDGIVMAVRHKTLPIAAIQFHPESILTPMDIGLQLVLNAVKVLKKDMYY